MAHNKSALKRIKQDEKKRLRNRARKGAVATFEKKFLSLIEANNIEEARKALNKCLSAYDKAAKKGVINKCKVDRKKSRLTLRLNKAQA
jgi:small subunit ribosomal protein S20